MSLSSYETLKNNKMDEVEVIEQQMIEDQALVEKNKNGLFKKFKNIFRKQKER